MSNSNIPSPSTELFGYPKFWAECFGVAPFLPMSRAEMAERAKTKTATFNPYPTNTRSFLP